VQQGDADLAGAGNGAFGQLRDLVQQGVDVDVGESDVAQFGERLVRVDGFDVRHEKRPLAGRTATRGLGVVRGSLQDS
jgi:hypothetical protein